MRQDKEARSTSAKPGAGGETHQTAASSDGALTTNQGLAISDNQNSLKSGNRGPTLLEDFILREKITHFDHERIPERIVHARGSGAHGYFQVYEPQSRLTKALFLQDPAKKTPVFVRFSTVAGGAGSADLVRDVRGFAVKFYTQEGNFDLVGNNIPVFFIQDAIKFPDLIHAVKAEPDRGFPQAASAHDTFWDFASLMPESMHMLMWAMSDRAIPRSYRMMQGFGVHTFRMINARGASTFVKFHWRPMLGMASMIWDEAVKINGADADFHRRDLWQAIERRDFPEYEFSVQQFDQKTADGLEYDVLDATKLIPEEVVPLTPIGKMVLNRNPDNFFAETEQVAFHPAHVVPGIDFSNDPLLQGRLFSYLDTQLSRLGGPNFHEIPVNRPKCPMRNFQRDGIARQDVAKGRVAYEPNSLDPAGPRELPAGFASFPDAMGTGPKIRERAEKFADHYSQARLFYRSAADPEKRHIEAAFAFELGKLETPAVRKRMLGHLQLIDSALGGAVAAKLGMEGQHEAIKPARRILDMDVSPALSIIKTMIPTIKGRKIGILVSDGVDAESVNRLVRLAKKDGASAEIVAARIGSGKPAHAKLPPDHALAAAPSVLFDAVILAIAEPDSGQLLEQAAAVDWVRDAFGHLKVIGYNAAALPLLAKAGLEGDEDEGLVEITNARSAQQFFAVMKKQRIWSREATVRP